MKLPACWCCQYKFAWKELLFFLGPKKCPVCKEKQFVTAKKRLQAAWSSPVTVILMFIFLHLFSFPTAILLGVFVLIIGITLSPFCYEFTNEQEPLF